MEEALAGGLGFDEALRYLKAGARVRRAGWNGKGMWLVLIPGSTFTVTEGRPMSAGFPVGASVDYLPHVDMKTADGKVVPWLCSQTDMLSEDWELLGKTHGQAFGAV